MPTSGPPLKIPVPENCSIWDWLFNSKYSPLKGIPTAERNGFRDAHTAHRLSFDAIREHATMFSSVLARKYELKAGDNVAVIAENSIWYPVAVFAALRLGLVVTALSPGYGPEELTYMLKLASTTLIVLDSTSAKACKAAGLSIGIPSNSMVSLDDKTDFECIKSLIEQNQGIAAAHPHILLAKASETCAFLSFSSGTTGLPKAVMISHRNVIAQSYQVQSVTRPGRAQTLLGILPFCHITGIVHILHLPLLLNQEVVLMSKFEMRSMLETVVQYRCEELWLVPPLLLRLANDKIARQFDLSCVKQFNTGAAPLAVEVISKLAKLYPDVAIRQAWGMTESCSCLTITPVSDQLYEHAHTVGKVVAGTDLKIVDPASGNEVQQGEAGEILARGPQVTMGYWQNDSATRETYDSEGYLHTGDLGNIDSRGFVVIHDRIKELIKVKGIGVAPAELEDLLLGHPSVQDVAVIGKPDAYAGEVPKAFVVLNDPAHQSKETVESIQSYVKQRKTRAKWLSGGVEFVDEIPKSAAGKILRKLLRDLERKKTVKLAARL